VAKGRILIVEDEVIIAHDLEMRLKAMDYDVCGSVFTGEDAIDKAGEEDPDIVLMDIMLKGHMDGIEAARTIRKRQRIPIVYITAFTNTRAFRLIKRLYPSSYLTKPFSDEDLSRVLDKAMKKSLA